MDFDYKYILVLPTIFSISIIGSMIKEYITIKYYKDDNKKED